MQKDNHGHRWPSFTPPLVVVAALACGAVGVVVGSAVVGAQTEQTQPALFVSVDAYRTFDSRVDPWFLKVPVGSVQEVSPQYVPGQLEINELPAGTVAVTYNVTVTDTEGAGYVQIGALPLTEGSSSNVNWSEPGQTVANSGITRVETSDGGSLSFGFVVGGTVDARTHVIIDISGYFVEA